MTDFSEAEVRSNLESGDLMIAGGNFANCVQNIKGWMQCEKGWVFKLGNQLGGGKLCRFGIQVAQVDPLAVSSGISADIERLFG